MATTLQSGYLLLADISGYTAFVAGTELEHAHQILSELLELIVTQMRPVLTIAQLEGGAVFAYAPAERLQRGETLLEVIETTYAAFKDRLESIRRRTTCTCAACRAAPSLSLSFLVHYGGYTFHTVAGRAEVMGLDVQMVRQRWLKRQMNADGQTRSAALFTEACLAHMGLTLPEASSGAAVYEPVGEIRSRVIDLHARYQEQLAARSVLVEPDQADMEFTQEFSAPPLVMWEWLNDPDKRTRWMQGRAWSASTRPLGRTGPGARNHCAHGAGALLETVLDWKPFRYFTVELQPTGMAGILQTYRLEPLADGQGTRLHTYLKFQTRFARRLIAWLARPLIKHDWRRLAHLLAEDMASQTRTQV